MPGNENTIEQGRYIPCLPMPSSKANFEQVMVPVVMHFMLVEAERAMGTLSRGCNQAQGRATRDSGI